MKRFKETDLYIKEDGSIWNKRHNRRVKGYDNMGYVVFSYTNGIWGKGVKGKEYLHRAVAMLYIPNPLGLKQINHINGIKTDNRVENLEWCTSKDNCNHAKDTGLTRIGIRSRDGYFTIEEFWDALDIHKSGMSYKEIAKKYNTGYAAISNMIKGKTYKEHHLQPRLTLTVADIEISLT